MLCMMNLQSKFDGYTCIPCFILCFLVLLGLWANYCQISWMGASRCSGFRHKAMGNACWSCRKVHQLQQSCCPCWWCCSPFSSCRWFWLAVYFEFWFWNIAMLIHLTMHMKSNIQKCAYADFFIGMNTGVQDAHNLAWKLGLMLNGVASPSILQTYESERRPVRPFSQAFYSFNVNVSNIELI